MRDKEFWKEEKSFKKCGLSSTHGSVFMIAEIIGKKQLKKDLFQVRGKDSRGDNRLYLVIKVVKISGER